MTVPLQFVDNFLLNYHVGHVLALLLVGAILAAVVLRSWEVLAVNLLLFGIIFVATPGSLLGVGANRIVYRIAGIVMMVFAPLTYTVMGGR
jgi:hypothetical protein